MNSQSKAAMPTVPSRMPKKRHVRGPTNDSEELSQEEVLLNKKRSKVSDFFTGGQQNFDTGDRYGHCYAYNNYARPTQKQIVKMAKDTKKQFASHGAQGILTQNTKIHFGGENELYLNFDADKSIKIHMGRDPLNSVWKLNMKEEMKIGDQHVESVILSQSIHSPKNTFTIKFWCDLDETMDSSIGITDEKFISKILKFKPKGTNALKQKVDVHLQAEGEDANHAPNNTEISTIKETNQVDRRSKAEEIQVKRIAKNVLVDRSQYKSIDFNNPLKAVGQLALLFFGQDVMATHSVTGKTKSGKVVSRKEQLPQEMLTHIINHVYDKFYRLRGPNAKITDNSKERVPLTIRLLRLAVMHKCYYYRTKRTKTINSKSQT